ncbi:MAG TPA: hypothetical protein VKC56_01995 [Gallionellaceae bacterium]|nr:hypothetical protein [Gallionellaceae bacterium]
MAGNAVHRGAAKAALFAVLFSMAAAAQAGGLACERQQYDPAAPAALPGTYEIVGRMPDSSATYGGTLEISAGKTAFVLKRTVDGNTMTGEAWIAACGKKGRHGVQMLDFKYTEGKGLLEGRCFLDSDLQDGMFLSCYTRIVGKKHGHQGLESAFSQND